MKVWITKYALTQGIFEIEAEIVRDVSTKMVSTVKGYFHEPDWHTSYEKSKEQADKMRNNALKSLSKKMKKLEEMKF